MLCNKRVETHVCDAWWQLRRKPLKPHPPPQAFSVEPFADPACKAMEDIQWQLAMLRREL
jgi:hypothetical protein